MPHTTTLDETADVVAPPPPSRLFWHGALAFGLVGLALVLLVVWAWWGHHRQLSQGSFTLAPAGLTTADDGLEDTRWVMKDGEGATASLVVSVRNDGPFPIRLLGPAVDDAGGVSTTLDVGFAPADVRGGGSSHEQADYRDELTLPAGQEAGVRVEISTGTCRLSKGSFQQFDAVPLRVSQLGMRSTYRLPLRLPIAVVGTTDEQPAACR
ncbi:hypothetical protein GCM10027446_12610 [Angustibacter peucedani]